METDWHARNRSRETEGPVCKTVLVHSNRRMVSNHHDKLLRASDGLHVLNKQRILLPVIIIGPSLQFLHGRNIGGLNVVLVFLDLALQLVERHLLVFDDQVDL